MLRLLTVPISIALLVAACSSGESSEFEVFFQHSSRDASDEVIWAFSGPAVEEGAICAEARILFADIRFENPDGSPYETPDTGAFVRVGEWACVDGSGAFTMRTLAQSYSLDTQSYSPDTWELTGGRGYENVSGEGGVSDVEYRSADGDRVGYRSADGDRVVKVTSGAGIIVTR